MGKTKLSVMAAVAVALVAAAVVAEGYGGRVGGRMEIKDVKRNEEVQRLGRFSVEEYNHRMGGGGGKVKFAAVIAAERQVVSGIKYYLRILGIQNGESKIFDSVVIVKPWIGSKRLLDFSPSIVSSTPIFNF
ncbi:cysteine proteinase inhibitor 4 [Benincasa hispida]|uniref:cysteine proteinase inhibitor 4 n=1 Tax=Benincasa hispida TaxID=102211 RepID=UPI001901B500|nr:cysteine proteinase inhibitor 4 [Benincasa hispida]